MPEEAPGDGRDAYNEHQNYVVAVVQVSSPSPISEVSYLQDAAGVAYMVIDTVCAKTCRGIG
eukprot:11244356-Alexandrium_andersonii.AAC.1